MSAILGRRSEAGNPRLSSLLAILKAFGVELAVRLTVAHVVAIAVWRPLPQARAVGATAQANCGSDLQLWERPPGRDAKQAGRGRKPAPTGGRV